SSRSNGQMPTCTTPIRATTPWRTAADSIRARTASSSLGLSNNAATLTNSAAAIAPSHHIRPRLLDVDINARMPQPDYAPEMTLRYFIILPTIIIPLAQDVVIRPNAFGDPYGRYSLGSGAVADSGCTRMLVTRQPLASLIA